MKYIPFFIIIVLLQVWVLNKIHLFGFATPLLYIYFIMKLPVDMNRNIVLLISVLLGFMIDFFGYSLGLNMLACTFLGFFRHYLLNVFAPRDMVGTTYAPSTKIFGMGLFMRYAGSLTLVHHTIFYIAESFSFLDPLSILIRVASSSVLTLLLVFGTEQINFELLKKIA